MLSRDLLRDDPEKVRQGLLNRNSSPAQLDAWLMLDAERRAALVEVEDLKRQRNEASRAIGEVKKRGGDAAGQIAAVGQLKSRIEELEARLAASLVSPLIRVGRVVAREEAPLFFYDGGQRRPLSDLSFDHFR